ANPGSWTITIRDAANTLVRTFTGTGTAVNQTWDGKNGSATIVPDGVYTATITATDQAGNTTTPATATVVVLAHAPTVTITSASPTASGQMIRFTARVSEPIPSIANLLNGTPVRFFNGSTLLDTRNLALSGGQFRATLTVPTFNAGTYSLIHADYPGTTNFLPATSSNYTHTVNTAALTVTADPKSKSYGAAVPALTFTANGLTNGDTVATLLSPSLATTVTQFSPAGVYTNAITQGTLSLISTNYTMTFVPATFTLNKTP